MDYGAEMMREGEGEGEAEAAQKKGTTKASGSGSKPQTKGNQPATKGSGDGDKTPPEQTVQEGKKAVTPPDQQTGDANPKTPSSMSVRLKSQAGGGNPTKGTSTSASQGTVRDVSESPPDKPGSKKLKQGDKERRAIARRTAYYRRATAASRHPVATIRRRAAMRDMTDELVARMAALNYYS